MKWFSKSEEEQFSKVKFINNRFIFEDETKPAKATFEKSNIAEITLNGSVVSGQIEFTKDDAFIIKYQNNVTKEPLYTLEIFKDENNEEALLQKNVAKGKGKVYGNTTDFAHNPKLSIKEQELYPEPIGTDEIEYFLKKDGLNGVFLDDNIAQISISEKNIALPVVRSKPAKPGLPAGFRLINPIKNNDILSNEQFFAEYVDETPGEPGYDIFGVELKPEELTFFPDFGENVMVEDRGLMSLKEGRLVFTPYSINVIEEKQVNQSLNYEDGLVEYDGDVLIDGDIKEGGQIKCSGNITVKGGVFDSYVFADGDIVIEGNIDSSVVYSGFSKIAARKIEAISLQYLEVMERVMFESSFSAEDGFDYEEKKKSLELAKSEFKAIQQGIDPFLPLVEQSANNEVKAAYNNFSTIISESIKVVLDDKSGTEDIKIQMERYYAIIEESKELLKDELGSLEAKSANSSHIFGYNRIHIKGTGTFQTMIESNLSVEVSGKSLSSSIIAENFIDVGEFNPGTQTEMILFVKKNNGYLKVNNLHSESVLQLGNKKYVSLDDENNVKYESGNFPRK